MKWCSNIRLFSGLNLVPVALTEKEHKTQRTRKRQEGNIANKHLHLRYFFQLFLWSINQGGQLAAQRNGYTALCWCSEDTTEHDLVWWATSSDLQGATWCFCRKPVKPSTRWSKTNCCLWGYNYFQTSIFPYLIGHLSHEAAPHFEQITRP